MTYPILKFQLNELVNIVPLNKQGTVIGYRSSTSGNCFDGFTHTVRYEVSYRIPWIEEYPYLGASEYMGLRAVTARFEEHELTQVESDMVDS